MVGDGKLFSPASLSTSCSELSSASRQLLQLSAVDAETTARQKPSNSMRLQDLMPIRRRLSMIVHHCRLSKDRLSQSRIPIIGESSEKVTTFSSGDLTSPGNSRCNIGLKRMGKCVVIAIGDHPDRENKHTKPTSGSYSCNWHSSYLHKSFAEKRKYVIQSYTLIAEIRVYVGHTLSIAAASMLERRLCSCEIGILCSVPLLP